MSRYKIKLQTCYQYLKDEFTIIHINAVNEFQADEIISNICKLIESNMDELSVYRIYSYDITLDN